MEHRHLASLWSGCFPARDMFAIIAFSGLRLIQNHSNGLIGNASKNERWKLALHRFFEALRRETPRTLLVI
jgi:hypothetical protein